MKKTSVVVVFFTFILLYFIHTFYQRKFIKNWDQRVVIINTEAPVEFQKGDILCRPNWPWLSGSVPVPNGRKYGHVAVVIKGGSGSTVEEALKNTWVIEALLFDQKTKTFLYNSSEQIREECAWISFGDKFRGIRYRLRKAPNNKQCECITDFLRSQLNANYNVLSLKHSTQKHFGKSIGQASRKTWHCATLTWKAFEVAMDADIDGNGGWLIYPSDIIGSSEFDTENGRIRF